MPQSPTANPNPAGSTYSARVLVAARWVTLCILVIAAVLVRLHCLACKPFWFDEGFSAEIARIDWRNFLRLMWWREANMSLYYVMLRMWLHFGQSEFLVRTMSVVLSAGTVPAVYWVGQMLYNRRVGIIAAALFTFNAYSVRYAQEARSYSLFLLLAALSSGFLVSWLRHPTRRTWVGYVLASILAVYAHFYALLLVAAHWLAVVPTGALQTTDQAELRTREFRRAWIAILVAVSPLIIFVAKTGAGPIKWIPRPGIRGFSTFFEHLAGGTGWVLLAISAGTSIVAVAASRAGLLKRAREWETWRCQFLLIWLLFPIVLTAALSFARPVFLARYMIFCLPALLILVAAGLARLKPWCFSVALLIVTLFLCMRATSFVYGHDFDNERDASEAASNFILDHSEPGDAIVFHIAGTRVPYEFFRSLRAGQNTPSAANGGNLGPEIVFPRHGPGLEYRDFTGKPTEELLQSAAVSHKRLWVMLMNNGTEKNPDPTTVMLSRVLPESLPQMQSWRFHLVEVRLYRRE